MPCHVVVVVGGVVVIVVVVVVSWPAYAVEINGHIKLQTLRPGVLRHTATAASLLVFFPFARESIIEAKWHADSDE